MPHNPSRKNPAFRTTIIFDDEDDMARVRALALTWNVTLAEALRTLVVWGLEQLDSGRDYTHG